jgi:hypothetical protein
MIQSFNLVDSQPNFDFRNYARHCFLEKQVLCTKEIILENTVHILNNMPISEMFEEKIQLLQANKIGLWDVLENCERKEV